MPLSKQKQAALKRKQTIAAKKAAAVAQAHLQQPPQPLPSPPKDIEQPHQDVDMFQPSQQAFDATFQAQEKLREDCDLSLPFHDDRPDLAPPPVDVAAPPTLHQPTPCFESDSESDDDDSDSDADSLSGRALSPSPEPQMPSLVSPAQQELDQVLASGNVNDKKRKSADRHANPADAPAGPSPRRKVRLPAQPRKPPARETRHHVDVPKATMLAALRRLAENFHDKYAAIAAAFNDTKAFPSVHQIQNTQAMLRSSPDQVALWFTAAFGNIAAEQLSINQIRNHLSVVENKHNSVRKILAAVCHPLCSQGSSALSGATKQNFPETRKVVDQAVAAAVLKFLNAIVAGLDLSEVMHDIINMDSGDFVADQFTAPFNVTCFQKDENQKRKQVEVSVDASSVRKLLNHSRVQPTASRDICSTFTIAAVIPTLVEKIVDDFVAQNEIAPSTPPQRTTKKPRTAPPSSAAAAADPQVAAIIAAGVAALSHSQQHEPHHAPHCPV